MTATIVQDALGTTPIGVIAARLPGATAVFRKAKLDFCCGGGVALSEAAAAKGVSLAALLDELAALSPADGPARPQDPEALIPFILSRFHNTHRRELPELVRLARRVEAVHRAHPEGPAGLADALEEMSQALEEHMLKEEVVLFPMMRASANPMIGHPIARMRHEHDEHGERLRGLETLARGFEPPADACNTWRALYTGLRKLTDDLMEHIHLENNVLFPQFAGAGAGSGICGLAAKTK